MFHREPHGDQGNDLIIQDNADLYTIFKHDESIVANGLEGSAHRSSCWTKLEPPGSQATLCSRFVGRPSWG